MRGRVVEGVEHRPQELLRTPQEVRALQELRQVIRWRENMLIPAQIGRCTEIDMVT